MILSVLEGVRKFLEKEAAQKIKLPAPGKNGQEGGFNLVHPNVLTEWIDQVDGDKDKYPQLENKNKIPCLMACMDEANDGNGLLINIRVAAICWNPGTFNEQHERAIDGVGYYDLINLLEVSKQAIISKRNFGKSVLEGGVKLRVYGEQPYPYWYGWLSFQVRGFGDVYVPNLNF